MSFDIDVAIVGAGVAGLSAAAALRAAGRRPVLFEALPRIGGRAFTDHPAALGGAPFDLGASWLHAADRNPLAPLARAAGIGLRATEGSWTRRIMLDGWAATEAELAAYQATSERFERLARARAAAGPDASVAEAVAGLRGDPWLPLVETWQATLIAAADPREFSVQDWHLNELTGGNLAVAGGVGAMVARVLAPPPATLHLATPVRHVAWDRPGGGVAITTGAGTHSAGACIVTVSTGVLRAGGIGFTPALPEAARAALDGLPMGLLSKLGIAAGPTPLLPAGTSLYHRVADAGERAMFFSRPLGQDHIVSFFGGRAAWALAAAGPAATEAFARAELARLLGGAPPLGPAVLSDWGTNPAFLGAYAYARPGCMAARAAMAAPIGAGLVIAGEAWCMDGLAGTVGGAFLSGARAAGLVQRKDGFTGA